MENKKTKSVFINNENIQPQKKSNRTSKGLKILIIIIFIIVFLIGLYSLYYFLIGDKYDTYFSWRFSVLPLAEDGDYTTVELYVKDFDKNTCELSYSNLTINESLEYPCDKLNEEEYDSEGYYKLYLSFNRYPLLPDTRMYLKDWKLIKLDSSTVTEQNNDPEGYINGIKALLEDRSILEAYSCILLTGNARIDTWACNDGTDISSEYLEVIYLLYQLGETLDDQELLTSVQEEIDYLNSNYLATDFSGGETPSAYLLKLVDIGLNEDFLQSLENFEVISLEDISIEISEREPLLISETEVYSNSYMLISSFADNVRIYSEYEEYGDLFEYNINRMIEEYNSSGYVLNGLCSIAYATADEAMFEIIKSKLESSIEDDWLILSNYVELNNCKKLSEEVEKNIDGLDEIISKFISNSSISNEEGTFLMSVSNDAQSNTQLIKFNMLHNLFFLLNE